VKSGGKCWSVDEARRLMGDLGSGSSSEA
jgi:hypothetical protein